MLNANQEKIKSLTGLYETRNGTVVEGESYLILTLYLIRLKQHTTYFMSYQ